MNRSIVWQLVFKDLLLAWPMIVGSLVLGVVSFAIWPWGNVAFFIGGSLVVVSLILLNIMVVSQSLIAERKEKIRVFMLSMPVSTTQYSVAKLLSSLLAYLVPAGLMTLASVILVLAGPAHGLIPLFVATSVHCLLYFCVFLAFALVTDSQGWIALVIVCGNISVSFVIPGLINLSPSMGPNLANSTAVWGPDVVAFIAIELVLAVAALVISFIVNSRKTEFV